MPSTFTWTPIDPPSTPWGSATHARAITAGNQWYGPFNYGTTKWAFVEFGQDSLNYADDWYIAAMSSTNQGTSWAEANSANHLSGHDVGGGVYWNGTTSYVSVAHKRDYGTGTPRREIILATFDMANSTWGAHNSSGVNPGGGATGPKLVQRLDGTWVVFFNSQTGNNLNGSGVFYVTYNGTVWGTDTASSPLCPYVEIGIAGQTWNIDQIQLDTSSGFTHFYYSLLHVGESEYFHRSLSSTNSLGTSRYIALTRVFNAIGVPTVWSGNLIVPYSQSFLTTTGTTTNTVFYPYIQKGTSATIWNPTWYAMGSQIAISTSTQVMAPSGGDNAAMFAVVHSGNLYVFWVTSAPPDTGTYGTFMNDILVSVDTGGGFGTPTLFYTETYASTNTRNDWWHNPSVTFNGTCTEMLVDRIYLTSAGGRWSVNGYLRICSDATIVPYYTDFAAWRSDGNTPNFTY